MKAEARKKFKEACKRNALSFDVTALASKTVAGTEKKVNRLIKKVPENGYLILENSDLLLSSLRPERLKDAEARMIINALIKVKTTTRPDISIAIRGRNRDLFFTKYFIARDYFNYIYDRPPPRPRP